MRPNLLKLSLFAFISLTMGLLAFLYFSRPFSHRLSSFQTSLSERTWIQKKNIGTLASYIDGKIIYPHQEFSLNQAAGPYTDTRGYLKERSYEEGQSVLREGGGICQLASTLFNASQEAGLQIKDRSLHQLAVQSVPAKRDAALAYGLSDLRFLNVYDFPVRIEVKLSGEVLNVEFWGKNI